MKIIVRISTREAERPPSGSPIHVQARDTTFEDAPTPIIASADGVVRDEPDGPLDTVELRLETLPDSSIVWVHVDVDRDGRLSKGDFVTMVSYPIPAVDAADIEVEVRRI